MVSDWVVFTLIICSCKVQRVFSYTCYNCTNDPVGAGGTGCEQIDVKGTETVTNGNDNIGTCSIEYQMNDLHSFTRSIDPTNPFQIQQTLDTSPLFKDETDLTYKYNQFVCTYELRNGQQSPLGGYQVDAQVWKCLCFQAYCNSPTLAYVQAQMGKQFMDLALVSQDVGSANQQQNDDKKANGGIFPQMTPYPPVPDRMTTPRLVPDPFAPVQNTTADITVNKSGGIVTGADVRYDDEYDDDDGMDRSGKIDDGKSSKSGTSGKAGYDGPDATRTSNQTTDHSSSANRLALKGSKTRFYAAFLYLAVITTEILRTIFMNKSKP